ncbi:MAG: phospholipase [Actinomycetota bacterium]|nr:phospholipase [Actinomycetota bacterium]
MSEQSQIGPSDDGSVVLDIGGDIGALILHAPKSLAGVEIEISPAGNDTHRSHVAIRERRGISGVRYAAIYPELRAGDYTVWDVNGEPADRVAIFGGEIAQLDWRHDTSAHLPEPRC